MRFFIVFFNYYLFIYFFREMQYFPEGLRTDSRAGFAHSQRPGLQAQRLTDRTADFPISGLMISLQDLHRRFHSVPQL